MLRYGYLATAAQEAGHEVLHWAPTFRHGLKRHRFTADTRVSVTAKFQVQFVHAPGYARNASLARLRAYRALGRRLRELAEREQPPDVIVAAIPSLEWAEAAIDYGKAHSVPVVIDVRDLWPDVFLTALPHGVRSVGRFLLAPYYQIARKSLSQADAITAVSETYLNWGLKFAGREMGAADAVFPIGFEPRKTSEQIETAQQVLSRHGIDPDRPLCLFAGRLEHSSDLETVLSAARRLASESVDVQFVLCGDGSKKASLVRQAADLPNIHFPGWIDAESLQTIASVSTIGLCAYAKDALQSLPNKPFEYMAAGLAIVSSLQGELARVLEQQRSGLTYHPGNAQELAHCIAQLIRNPKQLTEMCDRSYHAWSAAYRSRDIYARFVRFLEQLTERRAKQPHEGPAPTDSKVYTV